MSGLATNWVGEPSILPEGAIVNYDHAYDWAVLHVFTDGPYRFYDSCVVDPRIGVFVGEQVTA